MVLMWFAFVSLACMNPAPGKIRGWLRHPDAGRRSKSGRWAHLLANGDAGGMLLFGSFLAWAVFDRIAVKRRGDPGAPQVADFTSADAIALGVGTVGLRGDDLPASFGDRGAGDRGVTAGALPRTPPGGFAPWTPTKG